MLLSTAEARTSNSSSSSPNTPPVEVYGLVVTPLACVCLADKSVGVFRPTRRRCPRLGLWSDRALRRDSGSGVSPTGQVSLDYA